MVVAMISRPSVELVDRMDVCARMAASIKPITTCFC